MTIILATNNFLDISWQLIILGAIQGITEFLPISSTAHLKILPMLLGWEDPGSSVSAILQLGSILAVITYFRNDLIKIIAGLTNGIRLKEFNSSGYRLGIAILIGTLPIVVIGTCIKLFWPNFDQSFLRSVPCIGLISIVMATLLGLAEQTGKRSKSIDKISTKDGMIIGFFQALAIIPGTSRSGITLTSGLLNSFKREDSAKFSFLLGVPAIALAGIVELKSIINETIYSEIIPLFLGVVTSFIFSFISIRWMINFLQSNSTRIFITYRLTFGTFLLFWWWGSN
mgnify:CR=1 FL=1